MSAEQFVKKFNCFNKRKTMTVNKPDNILGNTVLNIRQNLHPIYQITAKPLNKLFI